MTSFGKSTADPWEAGSGGDDELARVLDAYLVEIEAGRAVDTQRLLAAHPAIADRLRTCLGSLRLVERAAGSLAPSWVPAERPEPERRLGDFAILREVGRGGMGVVYEAEQISLRRRVALKVLPFAAAIDPRQLQRFQLEAQAAATLHHPHIVPVHGVGCERGVHYYAMQFIDGRNLADLIRELRTLEGLEPLDPEAPLPTLHHSPIGPAVLTGAVGAQPTATGATPEHASGGIVKATRSAAGSSSVQTREYFRAVARLGVQAAEALEHAHQRGIVHRDVKPSNLLVDALGSLWITDFGLARCQTDHGLTMTGDLMGTLRYMSPEQVRAKRAVVDHRSDVYSLGVTLYELLTLAPAFDGRDRADILRRIADHEARPLRRLNPAVPYDLETVIAKAMDVEPSARYATAGEMADDLNRFLGQQPVRARRPSLLDRTVKSARRNKPAMAALLALALAVVAALGVFAVWRDGMLRRHNAALKSSLAAVERKDWANRQLVFGAQIRLAQQELEAGQVEFTQEALERLRPGPGEPDLRGFEWHHLRRRAHERTSVLFGHAEHVRSVRISPDGKTLVSGDQGGTIVFWDLSTWRERARTPRQGKSVWLLAVASDGRTVASACGEWADREVKLWDAVTGRETARIPVNPGAVRELAFSHDSRTLLVHRCHENDGSPWSMDKVWFWKITPTLTLEEDHPPPVPALWLAVAPDRRLCAALDPDGNVRVVDMATGETRRTLSKRFLNFGTLGYTPDGRSILLWNEAGMSFFDPATGKEKALLDVALVRPTLLSEDFENFSGIPFHRDGGYWLTDDRGKAWVKLERPRAEPLRFVFSPDGRLLAGRSSADPPTLWDTSTGKRVAVYSGSAVVDTLAFTPLGDSLILGCFDGRIRFWHIRSRPEPPDHLKGHSAEVWALAYTPDGKTVASAADDHTIKLWDPRDGELRRTLAGHESLVTSLAVSPDGTMLASGGFDRTVRLWDLPDGRPRGVLKGHTDRVRGVAFSPDGRRLASCASDGTVRLWDVATARPLEKLLGGRRVFHDVSFDRSGARVLSVNDDSTLQVWDPAGDGAPMKFSGQRPRMALALSRDGSTVAAGDDRGNVTIYDAETWTRRHGFKGSDGAIFKLAFSPDGRTLAAACGDAKVRLWDPATAQLTLVLDGHTTRVNAVAFSPDGSTLASASHDGAIKLWHADPTP